MAWGDQQQKTEPATPKRIREARQKGQVAKSAELTNAVLFLALLLLFYLSRDRFVLAAEEFFVSYLRGAGEFTVTDAATPLLAVNALHFLAGILGPVFLTAIVVALAVNLAQVGFLFAPAVLVPKLERVSIVSGLKRIFSMRGLVELAKALFKIGVVGGLLFLLIHARIPQMMVLVEATPGSGYRFVADLVLKLMTAAGAAYLLLALLDFAYQRYTYRKQLMMSRTELKEEFRQTEGDPQVRAWIRRRQRQAALNRIRQEVPRATVVVTNPVRLAVALRYVEGESEAPVVVAKGAGEVARIIRELAREHDIPLVENPPVARALFQKVDVGREIPVALYQAVAEILATIYRLRRKVL
ncbi:MAG: flagellar biosynthesis protein FlhB [Thermoanaerobacterales bacterium]|nr:flagellar biosynthesis protein FlhB [Thermoanaerobacterales bacterium]